MNEQQKRLVEMLNDMYQSQGGEYKSRYRDNYFELLQHIISPSAYINGEEIIVEPWQPTGEKIFDWLSEKQKEMNNE